MTSRGIELIEKAKMLLIEAQEEMETVKETKKLETIIIKTETLENNW